MQYKLHLYFCNDKGSWTPASGAGSKKTVLASSIILVGVRLTKKTAKINKTDKTKIIGILDKRVTE